MSSELQCGQKNGGVLRAAMSNLHEARSQTMAGTNRQFTEQGLTSRRAARGARSSQGVSHRNFLVNGILQAQLVLRFPYVLRREIECRVR